MKRDMDLVRLILLAIEEEPRGWAPSPLTIEGYTEDQIGFHVLLMGEAGLVKAENVTPYTSNSPRGLAVHMRWAGYEFLEAARKESVWAAAKSKIKDAGLSLPFELLKELLLQLAKQKIGLD